MTFVIMFYAAFSTVHAQWLILSRVCAPLIIITVNTIETVCAVLGEGKTQAAHDAHEGRRDP